MLKKLPRSTNVKHKTAAALVNWPSSLLSFFQLATVTCSVTMAETTVRETFQDLISPVTDLPQLHTSSSVENRQKKTIEDDKQYSYQDILVTKK